MNILKQIGIVSLSILLNSVNVYANEKFKVDGNTLHYNTEIAVDENNQRINSDDVDYLLKTLKENPNIKRLHLTSWGGSIGAAADMSDIIIDFGLNTHVKEICFSACNLLLIGGETRTLEKGSKIGFHRTSWGSESMKDYYNRNQEYFGWKNEFDFSSWVYDDSQEDIYKQFKYYIERGISPEFVIETMKSRSDDGWYPRRKELLKSNIITN